MGEFRMPALGADMEAGTLVEWLKQPGDTVHRGDIIAVVDTQKGAIEIEVFEDGVIDRQSVKVGERVPVGTVLAVIRAPGEAPTPAPAPATASPPAPVSGRPRASPAARALATELGVDLATVTGTGPDGAIRREDVERAAAAKPARAAPMPGPVAPRPAPSDTGEPRQAAMRAAIAAAMSRSKREIPHYYLSSAIDLQAALEWLRTENARRAVADRLLPVALLVKAVALALTEVPALNGFWADGRFTPGAGVHIGFAISLRGGGLVAPAVHDADRLDLGALMARLRDLTARARAGTLRSSELADPTITVTNLGDQGADAGFGIIYPPQVALVAFGRVVERPWIAPSGIERRPVMTVTLSADHRATDGHLGSRLLAALEKRLQEPGTL